MSSTRRRTKRKRPNILITGTPGTGKTSLAEEVASKSGMTHINLSVVIGDKGLHDGRDEKFDCFVLNEDKVCDALEDALGSQNGGYIVDFHSCDFFPERWFDLVVVLRCDNTLLFDRLKKRKYSEHKISENVTCEIMQTVLDEAKDSYKANIVKEVRSENLDEFEENVKNLLAYIQSF
mmetsp:Transcript_19609/g.29218  ORF Transcript_19609/g.29218 Transcript_19609/m.29218 type:complete len:178 (+) Transcript_19609:74-607(+)